MVVVAIVVATVIIAGGTGGAGGRRPSRSLAGATDAPSPAGSAAARPTAGSSSTPRPTRSGTPSPKGTESDHRSSSGSGGGANGSDATAKRSTLDLPRIPWEGGPAYWAKFPKAAAAGWTDPSFFPIALWWGGISNKSEVDYDKSVGINTYVNMSPNTPYKLFKDNDVFWVGNKLNSGFTSSSTNWVGDFLDDEVDGWASSPAAGRAILSKERKSFGDDGRFKYANFTQQVIGQYMNKADQRAYVNDFTDAVSVDQYYYTDGACHQATYTPGGYAVPVNKAHCETASSYGKTVASLRKRDASNGKLQPIWQFVEDLNGGPADGSAPVKYIQPGQLQGAVMDSVINEARGIIYFNQSFTGSCKSGNVVRQSQTVANFCADKQVAAMKQVDGKIHALAPVINTQSYKYKFGSGLDTMLKVKGGYAYIFAMINGSSSPGQRTFTLPKGIHGKSVTALYENRSIPVTKGGFHDSFAHEYSYHIYKVALD